MKTTKIVCLAACVLVLRSVEPLSAAPAPAASGAAPAAGPPEIGLGVEVTPAKLVLGQPFRLRGYVTNSGPEAREIRVAEWRANLIPCEDPKWRTEIGFPKELYKSGRVEARVTVPAGGKALYFDIEVPTGLRWGKATFARGPMKVVLESWIPDGERWAKRECESAPFTIELDDTAARPETRAVANLLVEVAPVSVRAWTREDVSFRVRLRNVGDKPLRLGPEGSKDVGYVRFWIYAPGAARPVHDNANWPLDDPAGVTLPAGGTIEKVFCEAWGVEEFLVPGPGSHVGHGRKETIFLTPGVYQVVCWFHAEDFSEAKNSWTGYARSNAASLTLLGAPFSNREGPLGAAAFSPDCKLAALAGQDGMIRIWDTAALRELRRFGERGTPVSAVAFSPDGKAVAAADRSALRLWDVASGKETWKAQADQSGLRCLAFSPDGRMLATGGGNCRVSLWDAATGKHVQDLKKQNADVKAVTFSPDGHRLASGTLYSDSTIRLWDTKTGELVQEITGHKGGQHMLVFSPDGKVLASAGQLAALHLWNTQTGDALRTLEAQGSPARRLAFSPDGRRIVTAVTTHQFSLWNIADGRETRIPGLYHYQHYVHAVAYAPDGQSVLTIDELGAILIWPAPQE